MNEKAVSTRATGSAVVQAKSAELVVAERQHILDVMQAVMREGVHYGTIPGTPKPTLYKPGSEVLLSTFHIAVFPEIQDLSTADEIRYRVLARGVHMETGIEVGVGVGEASTSEERYKWRKARSDKEFNYVQENERRIKFEWGDEEVYQVRTNPADLANTVLKMAKKRSQIDLTLTTTAASEIFTQDLDDMPRGMGGTGEEDRPAAKAPTERPQPKTGSASVKATGKQLGLVQHRAEEAGIRERDFCEHFNLDQLENLLKSDVDAALDWIKKANAGPN